MVPFVQATYALVTFVQISYISAITGPILTKFYGLNFLGVKIFVDQKMFLDKTSSDSNSFRTQNFFRHKCFQTQNLFKRFVSGQKFFGPTIFFQKKFSDSK